MTISITAEEHQRRLAKYNQGLSDRKIAKELNMNGGAIYSWRRLHDLPAHPKLSKIIDDVMKERFKECWEAGFSIARTARMCGVSSYDYTKWLRCENLETKQVFPGALTDDQKDQINELTFKGLTDNQIAAAVGCSYRQVCDFYTVLFTSSKRIKKNKEVAPVIFSNDAYTDTGRPLPPTNPPKPLKIITDQEEIAKHLAKWGITEQPKYTLSDMDRYRAKKEAEAKRRDSVVERLDVNNLSYAK